MSNWLQNTGRYYDQEILELYFIGNDNIRTHRKCICDSNVGSSVSVRTLL